MVGASADDISKDSIIAAHRALLLATYFELCTGCIIFAYEREPFVVEVIVFYEPPSEQSRALQGKCGEILLSTGTICQPA
ncbi:hypothetical protein J6590_017755 [Homalodisca vitripennis]|nr:hypothetical protein J6590_017755 [Homalodisca vitripennis]